MAYQVILTTIGEAKLAAGIVNLTHMAIGDGGGSEYQPTGSEIELVNEVYRKPLSSYNVTGNKVVMQLSIPLADGGFYVREAGIFDEDGDMIYIANLATRYKPLPTEGSASDLSVTLVSTVSNLANLSVIVDGTAYVTHSILAVELSDKLDKTNDKATSTEAAAATNSDKFMTPETVYTAYGSADPIVLTGGSTHTHAIDESIITGTIAPMTIELADTGDYPKSKRNRIALTIANLSNSNWTINGKASGSTNVTLSIAGTTNNPPVYALDATSLPTIANGAITSNVFTASANAASAQTFDHVMTGEVESITPKMTFTNGNVLTVDPSSTTGNTKFNYPVSNTVQVGSKLLIDLAGTISEVTVAAGSQTSNAVFDSSWGLLLFNSQGSTLWAIGSSNRKTAYSTDNGITWVAGGTLSGSGTIGSFNNIVSFAGALWIGIINSAVQSTSILYKSIDGGANWTTGYSQSMTDAGSSACETIAGKLVICFGHADVTSGSVLTYLLFYTSDGNNFNACSPSSYSSIGSGSQVINGATSTNGKLCFSPEVTNPFYTSDGNNFNQLANIFIAPVRFPRCTLWDGTKWICSTGGTSGINQGIYTATDGSTWTKRSADGVNCYPLAYNGYVYAGANHATTSVYYSSDAIIWDATIVTGATFRYFNFCTCNGVFFTGDNGANKQLMWKSNASATSWASSNLNTGTYQFTMTSPSIAVPTWAALGGQTEQYSVSATSTPSFNTATSPTHTRSGNVITATYAQVTGASGTHVQLKASSLNSGDVLTQIGATLLTVGRQTINSKTSMTLAAGKVAMMLPTPNGWLST